MGAVELTTLALIAGLAVSLASLLSPILKLHSRLDLLEYRLSRIERILTTGVPDQK